MLVLQGWESSLMHNRKLAIEIYKNEISGILQSFDIKTNQFRLLANKYHALANQYFNSKDYDNAASYYLSGVRYLEDKYNQDRPQFLDQDFLALTKLYIDLSDALNNLNQSENAYIAFSQAIQAFGLINNKTDVEKTLLNLNDNYVAFRNYIESKTSQPNYLSTKEYAANGEKLQTESEIGSIGLQFNEMGVDPNHDPLANSLSGLSFFSSAQSAPQSSQYSPGYQHFR